jgi:rhodanese-related sulfurtransferase
MVNLISPADYLANAKDFVLVDVRSSEEWSDYHEKEAIHFPVDELDFRMKELPKKNLALICRSGNRSAAACAILSNAGFDAVNIAGGIAALIIEKRKKGMISEKECKRLLALL